MIDALVGAGMGMLFQDFNDRRQMRQQEKLIGLQSEANKDMLRYQNQMAMDFWKNTNYAEQVKQAKKAGLSTGLLYGKGGGSGMSIGTGSASVNAPAARDGGMDIATGMQLQLLPAQKANIEADTKNKEATANKTAGVDTALGYAQIGQIGQNITESGARTALLGTQKALADLEVAFKQESWEDSINEINYRSRNAKEQLEIAVTQNKVSRETADEQIKLMELGVIGAGLENELKQQGINKSKAEIAKLVADVQQGWANIRIGQQNANANTSNAASNATNAQTNIRNAWTNEQNANSNERNSRASMRNAMTNELRQQIDAWAAENGIKLDYERFNYQKIKDVSDVFMNLGPRNVTNNRTIVVPRK